MKSKKVRRGDEEKEKEEITRVEDRRGREKEEYMKSW